MKYSKENGEIFKGKWQIKIVSKSKYSPVGLFTEVEIACLKFAEMKTSQRNVIKPRNVSERQAPNRYGSNFEFRIWRGEKLMEERVNGTHFCGIGHNREQ